MNAVEDAGEVIDMKLSSPVMVLFCIVVLAGCMSTPLTDAERAAQAHAEEERRWKVINTGP